MIEENAKSLVSPNALDKIANIASNNLAIGVLLPADEGGKKALIASAINYAGEIAKAGREQPEKMVSLIKAVTQYQNRDEKTPGKIVIRTPQAKKEHDNKLLSSAIQEGVVLLKDPKIMAANSKFLSSNSVEIAAIIDQKLESAKAKNPILGKINGRFCVQVLKNTNTPKGIEAVERLIQKPGVINGLRAAVATKNLGLLIKTVLFGASSKSASSQTIPAKPALDPKKMQAGLKARGEAAPAAQNVGHKKQGDLSLSV